MGSPQDLMGISGVAPRGRKRRTTRTSLLHPPPPPAPSLPSPTADPWTGGNLLPVLHKAMSSKQRKLSETPLLPTPTPTESPGPGCGEPQVCVGDLNSKAELWWVGTVSWSWNCPHAQPHPNPLSPLSLSHYSVPSVRPLQLPRRPLLSRPFLGDS